MQKYNFREENDRLLTLINDGISESRILREKVQRLKLESKSNVRSELTKNYDSQIIAEESFDEVIDEDFEDEIKYYLEDYLLLGEDFTKEDLLEILPSIKNSSFKDIIRRLQAESFKEILEYKSFIDSDCFTLDDIEDIKRDIELEKRKIDTLKEILVEEKDNTDTREIKNKLVLTSTSSGNIRILEELSKIDSSFYDRFLEIINSIVDGTFKGVKRFNSDNNVLAGISEVRGYQVRVLFKRLNKDTYAIISSFTKKNDNDRGYRNYIANSIEYYKNNEDKIKSCLDNSDFIKMNDDNVSELYRMLGCTTEKVNKKGGLND